jgi:preprotein translocase subunit SecG
MLTLAAVPAWLINLLVVLFVFVCVIMILAVLYQKPSGGGLAGAFGGGNVSSGQTAFGAKTGDALTIFTIAVFVVFLLAAISLVHMMRPDRVKAEPPAAQPVVPVQTAPPPAAPESPPVGEAPVAAPGGPPADPAAPPATQPADPPPRP